MPEDMSLITPFIRLCVVPVLFAPIICLANVSSSQDISPSGIDQSTTHVAALERLANEFTSLIRSHESSSHRPGTVALSIQAQGEDEEVSALEPFVPLLLALLPGRLLHLDHVTRVVEVPSGNEGLDRARSLGASLYIEARLFATKDELLLTGVLRSAWMNFWTGKPHGDEPRLVEAAVTLDPAARRLLVAGSHAGPRRGSLRLREIARLFGRPISVSIGDLTGDGRGEVVALLEDELVVLAVDRKAGTEELARRSLRGRPRALITSRDSAGGVAVTWVGERPVIVYHHSGLAEGEVLTLNQEGKLEPLSTLLEHPIACSSGTVAYARLRQGTNLFEGSLRVIGPEGGWHVDLDKPIVAAAIDPARQGLLAIDSRYRLFFLEGGGSKARKVASPVGSTLTLADIASDGTLLRASSAPRPPSNQDEIVISNDEGRVLELRPTRGTIRHMATGDVTGFGRDEIVVITEEGEDAPILLFAELDS